jgi:hypothetical protein
MICLPLGGAVLGQQPWTPVEFPFYISFLDGIWSDTLADALYFCGESHVQSPDGDAHAIAVYHGGQLDTLGFFDNRPTSALRWHDTLIVGGGFELINGAPYSSIAAYANGEWVSYGAMSEGSVYRLRVIDDELYAVGAFETADGHLCNGLAKRQGSEWVNIGSIDAVGDPNMRDLVEYNDTLVATGAVSLNSSPYGFIIYFNGSEWLPLGQGIVGSFPGGASLAVYNDDLYVSGSIDVETGNPCHGIMRWNGSGYEAVGTGFQDEFGTTTYNVGALEMEAYDGLLWACGTFSYAGNQSAPGLAVWDGTAWCSLPAGPTPEINAMEFFHDTLFTANHWFFGTQTGVTALRFNHDLSEAQTCDWTIGVEEGTQELARVTVFYADGTITVNDLPAGAHDYRVFDALGRSVLAGTMRPDATGRGEVRARSLPAGAYVIAISERKAVRFVVER